MTIRIKGFGGIRKVITLLSFLLLAPIFVFAEGDKSFNAGDMIIEHVTDAHSWHIIGDYSIPLPIILYSKDKGLMIFSSSKLRHGGSFDGLEKDNVLQNGFKESGNKIVVANPDGTINKEETDKLWDFSITKNTATVFLVAILLLVIFISVARAYANQGIQKAPKGLQSFMEPVILFIRDDIAIPSVGKEKAGKYMPYLLTLFFFILFFNIFGLIPVFPGGANTMGNISITMTFAVMTFLITMASSNKAFWAHTLWMPNVPAVIKILILTPIEILGVFLKPFTLIVRVFANILAGHIIALSLIGLIFIIGNISRPAGYIVSPFSVAFTVFMTLLDVLVAFIQAYVFTFLSAMYFGMAQPEEHHH
jgi:F-type H+-transporting ATPase subunit a